MISTNMKEKQ